MRWLVGIDLRGSTLGALHMASWLRAHTAIREEFHGVHVLDERLGLTPQDAALDEMSLSIDAELLQLESDTKLANPLTDYRIERAHSVESGIANASANLRCDGLILGGRGPPRLGRTARRLLRRLLVPTMLVSHDVRCASIGSGPVLLATDLGSTSERAARVARKIADAIGRQLLVVSVDVTGPKLELLSEWITVFPRRSAADIQAWAVRHDLRPCESRLDLGDLVGCLVGAADEVDAPLVVCGSRYLDAAGGIYTSSTGGEIARRGERAVLVVPEGPSQELR